MGGVRGRRLGKGSPQPPRGTVHGKLIILLETYTSALSLSVWPLRLLNHFLHQHYRTRKQPQVEDVKHHNVCLLFLQRNDGSTQVSVVQPPFWSPPAWTVACVDRGLRGLRPVLLTLCSRLCTASLSLGRNGGAGGRLPGTSVHTAHLNSAEQSADTVLVTSASTTDDRRHWPTWAAGSCGH